MKNVYSSEEGEIFYKIKKFLEKKAPASAAKIDSFRCNLNSTSISEIVDTYSAILEENQIGMLEINNNDAYIEIYFANPKVIAEVSSMETRYLRREKLKQIDQHLR